MPIRMTRVAPVSLLVVSCAASLACTGLGLSAPSGNRDACERYVEHMNGLDACLGLTYEASNLCQEVDATPVDMAPFYDCLVAHSSCAGSDASLDLEQCEAPVLDLLALTTAPE